MATGVISWSQTAGTNATADSAANWAEGMAPSAVNDSARGMMSSVAKWRDDICGIITTGGTSTAYTITSNQVQSSNTDGMTVQFTPHTTNGTTVTLSVDSQTARPLRFYTGIELPAGVLISGSLYKATYRAATTEWLLHAFDASIYSIPIGGTILYWALAAPSGSFALLGGQAISRTTYATLFNLIGTQYGPGNGSTTFNLPDLFGRVPAMIDPGSSRLTSTYFGGNPTLLGSSGGLESTTLLNANLPAYTPSGSFTSGTLNSGTVVGGTLNSGTLNSGLLVGGTLNSGTLVGGTASVNSTNWVASSSSDSTAFSLQTGASGSIGASLTGGSVSKIASTGTASGSVTGTVSGSVTGTVSGTVSGSVTGSVTGTLSMTAQGGISTPLRTVQPTIIANYLIRVL